MNTYKINEFEQVVPYTSGRLCNDTRAWRDATELELQQQEETRELTKEIDELKNELREIENNFKNGVYL